MPNHLCYIICLDEYESINDEADVFYQKVYQSLNQWWKAYCTQMKQNSKTAVLNFNSHDFKHLNISNSELGRIFECLTETLKIASSSIRVIDFCMSWGSRNKKSRHFLFHSLVGLDETCMKLMLAHLRRASRHMKMMRQLKTSDMRLVGLHNQMN